MLRNCLALNVEINWGPPGAAGGSESVQEMAAQQFLQQVGSTGQTATEEEMLQMQALVAQFEAQGMQKLKENVI